MKKMLRTRAGRVVIGAILAAGLASGLGAATARPAAAADNGNGTVHVVHGIPGLTADVYVNGKAALTGFKPGKAPSWFSGYIYNPNDGRTFNSTIHVQDDGSIKVRGFVGVSLFGKTVEWVRPQERLDRCS